jgi:hypothetical protein
MLLAVLLFGNCSGGVREVVNGLSRKDTSVFGPLMVPAGRAALPPAARCARQKSAARLTCASSRLTASADSLFGPYGNGRNVFPSQAPQQVEHQALRNYQ